jgi:hypothetical protein
VLPSVSVTPAQVAVPRTYVGTASRMPLTLANTSDVDAVVEVNLLEYFEWQLGCPK